mmetsp:Transcript_13456/g.32677  ORF Transcript_13456/g.32677 Transcript_13456/m.32677 type:complete len:260 (+) Transcript_13456:356-1135(+)
MNCFSTALRSSISVRRSLWHLVSWRMMACLKASLLFTSSAAASSSSSRIWPSVAWKAPASPWSSSCSAKTSSLILAAVEASRSMRMAISTPSASFSSWRVRRSWRCARSMARCVAILSSSKTTSVRSMRLSRSAMSTSTVLRASTRRSACSASRFAHCWSRLVYRSSTTSMRCCASTAIFPWSRSMYRSKRCVRASADSRCSCSLVCKSSLKSLKSSTSRLSVATRSSERCCTRSSRSSSAFVVSSREPEADMASAMAL